MLVPETPAPLLSAVTYESAVTVQVMEGFPERLVAVSFSRVEVVPLFVEVGW